MVLAQAMIDTTSAVSIGVLIVVLGASVKVSSLLTRIDEKLRAALEQLAVLSPLPSKFAVMEQRQDRLEADVNELWGIHREGDSRRPPK